MLPGPAKAPVSLRRKRIWTRIAHVISTIFNPFVTALVLFVIMSARVAHDTLDFWRWMLISISFTSLLPLLYILWLYLTDRISDLDMSDREERAAVFGAFTVFYGLGTIVLAFMHGPAPLIATMAGYTASTAGVQFITRYWKISTHALGIAAPLVAVVYMYGARPLPFLVLIPIVCWARIYLKAHTLGQVIGGAALAASSVALFFHLFGVQLTPLE